ncbi:unnamed protein product [Orchesella dallaii]|uniref:DUF4625 domain-containing protein n=1 Tax=Orchesella dallaii TaxID=48710 RepID=A0ABP1R957_9HEXA
MLRIIGLLTLTTLASSLNCGIQGENGASPIVLPAVTESEVVGEVILGVFPIYNVSATGAVSSPHARYLRVLRYESRYEILSAAPFPEFVQTERSQLLVREVIFTCSDGDKIQYTIQIPILDENTEAPAFNAVEYNVTVTASENGQLIPIDAGIAVYDADVDKSNANLILKSSNARLVPLVYEMANSDAFAYKFDLMVPDEMDVGDYQVILTADDGKYSASAMLKLTVIGEEEAK